MLWTVTCAATMEAASLFLFGRYEVLSQVRSMSLSLNLKNKNKNDLLYLLFKNKYIYIYLLFLKWMMLSQDYDYHIRKYIKVPMQVVNSCHARLIGPVFKDNAQVKTQIHKRIITIKIIIYKINKRS